MANQFASKTIVESFKYKFYSFRVFEKCIIVCKSFVRSFVPVLPIQSQTIMNLLEFIQNLFEGIWNVRKKVGNLNEISAL